MKDLEKYPWQKKREERCYASSTTGATARENQIFDKMYRKLDYLSSYLETASSIQDRTGMMDDMLEVKKGIDELLAEARGSGN